MSGKTTAVVRVFSKPPKAGIFLATAKKFLFGSVNIRAVPLVCEEFGAGIKESVKTDETLKVAERAFLEFGSLRNQLVHQNFAVFPLDKTTEEVFQLYEIARLYVEFLVGSLEKP